MDHKVITLVDEFLKFELGSLGISFDDLNLRSYAVVGTIAAAGRLIRESTLKMYLSSVAVDKEIMDAHLACFCGMEILDVLCDCKNINEHCLGDVIYKHPAYALGCKYKARYTFEYIEASFQVSSLREKLDMC